MKKDTLGILFFAKLFSSNFPPILSTAGKSKMLHKTINKFYNILNFKDQSFFYEISNFKSKLLVKVLLGFKQPK